MITIQLKKGHDLKVLLNNPSVIQVLFSPPSSPFPLSASFPSYLTRYRLQHAVLFDLHWQQVLCKNLHVNSGIGGRVGESRSLPRLAQQVHEAYAAMRA